MSLLFGFHRKQIYSIHLVGDVYHDNESTLQMTINPLPKALPFYRRR